MKFPFEPLVFRTGLVAPNRVVLAPMTNKQSHADGSLGDDELRWLDLPRRSARRPRGERRHAMERKSRRRGSRGQ